MTRRILSALAGALGLLLLYAVGLAGLVVLRLALDAVR